MISPQTLRFSATLSIFYLKEAVLKQMMRPLYFLPISLMFIYFGSIFQYGTISEEKRSKGPFQAAFFLRFCAIASKPHSMATFSLPRSINLRNPCFCLIFPNTGSTSKHRFFRRCRPSSLFNSLIDLVLLGLQK